jgi:hypothetical protein
MSKTAASTLGVLLSSAGRAQFEGSTPDALEDGMSHDDVQFLNASIRESQAQAMAGQGIAPSKEYFEAKRQVLRAAIAANQPPRHDDD